MFGIDKLSSSVKTWNRNKIFTQVVIDKKFPTLAFQSWGLYKKKKFYNPLKSLLFSILSNFFLLEIARSLRLPFHSCWLLDLCRRKNFGAFSTLLVYFDDQHNFLMRCLNLVASPSNLVCMYVCVSVIQRYLIACICPFTVIIS